MCLQHLSVLYVVVNQWQFFSYAFKVYYEVRLVGLAENIFLYSPGSKQ